MSFMDEIRVFADKLKLRHDYFHGAKGRLEKPYQKIKNWRPENDAYEIGRTVSLIGVDLAWFLFCVGKFGLKDTKNALNTIFLNNSLIEKWSKAKQETEVKDTDSKFKKFFENLQKTHPLAAARLKLWMVYTLMALSVSGGVKLVQHKEDIKDKYTEMKQFIEKKMYKYRKYNPSDDNFINSFINDNWEEIVIGLLEFESYHDKPVLQSGESRYTYGPGLTWVYIKGEQYPCVGKYKDMAENFSDKEIWDQVRQHCLYKTECLPRIRKCLVKHGFDDVSVSQALALMFAGYQLSNPVKDIISRLKAAGNDEQKIIDAFIAGNEVKQKWRNGTNKRRWWCAMLYAGKISIEDFVNMDRDAFSKIDIDKILQDGHFVFDEEIILYALSQKKPSTGNVQDFIISKHILDDVNTIFVSKKPKPKVIAFNDGVLKIKNRRTNNIVYQFNDEYQA